MRVVRENATSAIVNIARTTCAAGISLILTSHARAAIDIAATHRCRQKAAAADSESRFLAIKKFSCTTAWRLIVARQTRFFAEIAAADSRCDFPPRHTSRRVAHG
jgi:hypothetical protein